MEIFKGHLFIEQENNDKIKNIKIVSIEEYVTFKYELNNVIKYTEYIPNNKLENYIFIELLNNYPLWYIEYDNSSYTTIIFTVYIDINLISDLKNNSIGFNFLMRIHFSQSLNFSKSDFLNKSYIPKITHINKKKINIDNFKLILYDYQYKSLSKMIEIENNNNSIIDYSFYIKINENNILFDPIFNQKINDPLFFNIKTKGGILADEMGLGKTILSIALIISNPLNNIKNIIKNNKINTKATLIICPSHLIKQWESEIKRCNTKIKILTIITKSSYNNIIFNDFLESDIIITSHQFIMNFKFYPTLYYYPCNPSNFNFEERNNILQLYFNNNILNNNIENIKKLNNPIFEFFNFHRLILDEGHEIFGELLTSNSLSKYMSKLISNISSNYYWYVSGTPFINLIGLQNCAKFINLKLEDNERNININFNDLNNSNNKIKNKSFLNKDYIWNSILNNICIRHRKNDINDQVNIPGYDEKIIWVNFTEIERKLYDSKKNKMSNIYLQQLCCHPLIIESSKKIFGNSNVEIDLSLMKDKLIEYHKINKNKYTNKLNLLDVNNQAYHMLKKSYENQISESNFLLNILDKINSNEIINDDSCVICMDEITNPALTACGHLYCYDCIKICLNNKKICPMCKKNLNGKDLMIINKKKENHEETNPLILKYGSKLGKLISIIRNLVIQNDTRIIIFSQWDDMLTLIGNTLSNNYIENSFIKGNVHARNASINKFKLGGDNKVIMLSLKNTASGTNLTEATHIFFVEPINTSIEECEIIERQAIARACRIGQKKKVSLIRILIKNTIEEEIYKKNYAHKNIKEINNNEIEI